MAAQESKKMCLPGIPFSGESVQGCMQTAKAFSLLLTGVEHAAVTTEQLPQRAQAQAGGRSQTGVAMALTESHCPPHPALPCHDMQVPLHQLWAAACD